MIKEIKLFQNISCKYIFSAVYKIKRIKYFPSDIELKIYLQLIFWKSFISFIISFIVYLRGVVALNQYWQIDKMQKRALGIVNSFYLLKNLNFAFKSDIYIKKYYSCMITLMVKYLNLF